MSTDIGHTNTHPSASGAFSAGAAAWPIATQGYLVTQDSLETGTGGVLCQESSFSDSLEESSASDSLFCHNGSVSDIHSPDTGNEFSDSLEESGSDSDLTEYVESDSDSFYSIHSNLTTRGGDSSFSLEETEYLSETTLYNSAQSIQPALASSTSSFGSFDTPRSELSLASVPGHRNSFCTQANHQRRSLEARSVSESSWEYASCPDLLHTQLSLTSPPPDRNRKPFVASASHAYHLRGRRAPRLSQGRTSAVNSDSMSTIDGAPSPKLGEDGEKKKKGLMSSFRKSRKTSRKLRLQKKAGDTDSISSSVSAVTSDGEPEMCDSEASAPNSPLPVKSDFIEAPKDDDKGEDATDNLDSHQATHERLNGSSSPKDSATSSMNSSPAVTKKLNDAKKPSDEKEERKKEKSKFGFLSRKESKKLKADQKASAEPVLSEASPITTDPDTTSQSSSIKDEDKKEDGKDEAEDEIAVPPPDSSAEAPENTGAAVSPPAEALENTGAASSPPAEALENTGAASPPPAETRSSSFRSYISSVQFVKNWTGSSDAKGSVDVPDSRDAKPAKPATAEENDTKKTTTPKSPSNEAGASTDKREHLYKILVIGELGTGKTSIIKRYVHQFFSQHYRATIGVDFALKVLNWDSNTVIRLQLWDIAGQERFGNMTRVYYKEAVGAFVVFDVTRAQTFDAVTKWKTDLDTKVTLADGSPIPAVLLANKCDQPKEGVVNNPARMDDYCRERGFSGWFETSAKENINIDEASRFLVNKILSNEKQGMMMTESLDTDKFSIDGKPNPTEKAGCRC
ncbi:clumping factor A-like [Penaeus japonicus]|uniref:clumping factor A-like n=1 Tax=Penaeus japonicus TaxID=27405 RepID=UPI001C716597|nr:clumping factor A-like [Penaeus japonicus]XP_042871078.1 clumping factor A-like [Penaeus japonicus]